MNTSECFVLCSVRTRTAMCVSVWFCIKREEKGKRVSYYAFRKNPPRACYAG
ncbi:hypothetical protein HMPREF3190_01433 [Umbribacter vaginalis]|nr:hypothetical protein HMPREF3190_01433 [Coriobacteriales bacterium DNF00809]